MTEPDCTSAGTCDDFDDLGCVSPFIDNIEFPIPCLKNTTWTPVGCLIREITSQAECVAPKYVTLQSFCFPYLPFLVNGSRTRQRKKSAKLRASCACNQSRKQRQASYLKTLARCRKVGAGRTRVSALIVAESENLTTLGLPYVSSLFLKCIMTS